MKKGSYWISISDLMAGVVGILVLFFVVAILTIISSQIAVQEEKQRGTREVVQKLSEQSKNNGMSQGLEFFPENSLITLPDSSFAQGSACINESQKADLQQLVLTIIEALSQDKTLGVQIEGHTDIVPVQVNKTNRARACAPFDDNYTLSAGRAREARNAIFSEVDRDSADWMKRVSVVGYGPDRLIDNEDPTSAKNRRVEIRIISIDD